MTATSLLQSKIPCRTEDRDRLYFDLYQYAFTFYCKESHALREKDAQELARRVRFRQNWNGWPDEDTALLIDNLTQLQSWLFSNSADIKYTVSYNYVNVYTNSIAVINDLYKQCSFISFPRVKEANIARSRNTITLKNPPKYKLRTYLKARWVEESTKQQLASFFETQTEGIKPSGAFASFLNNKHYRYSNLQRQWIPEHYYVEHDDTLYLTMMSLIMPGSIRKTMQVVQRINN